MHVPATALFETLGVTRPEVAGADFVSVVEGLVFDRVAAARSLDGIRAGTPASVEQLARVTYLRGVARVDDPPSA
ncbi:hypothetical protein R8Z50_16080 [Longispora sp. K20-0274]|uniref:hypothetical protein n=1 Tax=Longispora sp. K20-0274 TaxID=3088255 RepID=UPI00399BEFDD